MSLVSPVVWLDQLPSPAKLRDFLGHRLYVGKFNTISGEQ